MTKKPYFKTIIIALCFAAWPLIIPPIVGIVLLILQIIEINKLIEQYGEQELLDSKINASKRILSVNVKPSALF